MDNNNCQICLSNLFANSNSLYSCSTKGCNIKVHKDCYGINSNETWACQRCHEYGKAIEKPCDLCPTSKGPIKKSLKAGWVHIICALYVPEAYFLKPETLEKLSYSQTALHDSKNKLCYICLEKQRQDHAQKGLKILCQHEGCKMYFHATCGLNAGNLTEEINESGTNCGNVKMQVVNYIGYCNQHRLQHKKEGIADKFAFNSPPNLNTLYAKIPARYKRAQDTPTQAQATTSSNSSSSSKFGSKIFMEPGGKEPKNSHRNATDTITPKDSANHNNGSSNSFKSTPISSGLEWMKGAGGSNVTTGTASTFAENNIAKSGSYKIPKRKSEPIIMEKVEEKVGTNRMKEDTILTSKKGAHKDSTSSSESGCGSHHSKLALEQGGKKGSLDSVPKNDKFHQGSLARSSSYNPTSGSKKNNGTTSSSTSKGGIVISSDYFLAGAKNYLAASNTKHNNNDTSSSQSSEPRKSIADSSKGVATKDRGDKQHVTTTPVKSSSTTAKGSPSKAANNKGGRDDGKETPSKSSKSLNSQSKKPGSSSTSTEQRRALASDIARKIVSHEAPDKLCGSGSKSRTDPALGKEGTSFKKQRHENEHEPTKGTAKRVKVEDSPTTTIVLGKKSTIPLLIKPPTQQTLPTPLEVEKGESSGSVGLNKAHTLSEAQENGGQADDTISAYFAKYRRFKSGPSSSVSSSPSDDDKSKNTKEVVLKAWDSLEETKADSSAPFTTATQSDVFLIASPQSCSLNLIAQLETENKPSVNNPAVTLKIDELDVGKSDLETDDDNKHSSTPDQAPTETHSISDILSKTSPLPASSTPVTIIEIPPTTTTSHKMELVPDEKESEDKIVSKPVPEIAAAVEPEKIVISEVELEERQVDVVIGTKELPLNVDVENSEIQNKSSRLNDKDQDCPTSTSSPIDVTVEQTSKTEPLEGKVVPKPRDRESDSEEGPRPFLASPLQQHRSSFLIPPSALAYHSPPSSSLLYDHQGLLPPPLGGGGGAASLPYPPHPLRYDPYLFNMATAMFGPAGPTHPNPGGPSYFDSANAYHLSWAANAYAAGLFGPPLLSGPAPHYPNLPAGSLQQQQQPPDFLGVKEDYLSPKQQSKTGQQGKLIAEERAFFGSTADSLEQGLPVKSLSHHKPRQVGKGAVAVSTSSVAGKGAEGKKSARGSAVSLHAEPQHVAINMPASSAIEQHESPTVTHVGGGVKRKASATFSTPAQSRALVGSASGSAKKRQQQLSRVQETIAAVAAAVSTTPISTSTTPKSVVAQGATPQVGKGKTLAAPKPSVVDSSSAAPVMDESDNSTVSLEDPGAQRSSAKQAPSPVHQQHFISKELNPALLAGIGMPYVNEGVGKGISAPGGRFVPAPAYYGPTSDAGETNSLARMEFISTHAAYMLAPSLMLSNNRIPSYSDVLTMTTNASFLNNPQYMVSRERGNNVGILSVVLAKNNEGQLVQKYEAEMMDDVNATTPKTMWERTNEIIIIEEIARKTVIGTQCIFNPASYASGIAMGLKAGHASLDFEPRSRSFSVEAASERGNLVSPNSAMKKTIAPETWENVIQAHVDSFMRTMPGEKASFDLNTFLQSLAAQVDENKVNESKLSKLRMRAGQLALENAQLSERLNALLGSGNLESVHSTLTAPPVIS